MSGSAYHNLILKDDPIAFWTFDEISGTHADNLGLVGDGLDATYSGDPILGTPGLADDSGAIKLDGIDDGVLLSNHSSLNAAGSYTQKTIELWFNADDTDGTQVLYEQGGYTNGLNIYLDGSTINMGAWRSHSGSWLNTSISAGQTYHVAFVFDAGMLYGYLNGALIGTASTGFSELPSHTDTGAIAQVSGGTRLSNSSTTASSNNFAGTIDNVALYNNALSVEHVTAHYDARTQTITGGPGDDVLTGGSGDDTLVGDRSQQGLNLDGVNDYVEVANGTNLHITNEITVETWIKVDSFTKTWQAIVTKGDNSWRLHRYGNSNVLNFALGGGGGRSVTGQTNVNDGQWHHVAATFDGEYLRLYVNGELDGELYSPGAIPQNNYRVLLGSNAQRLGRNFDGQLDEVQLWDVARTQAEIQSSMNNGIAATIDSDLIGINEGLVGHWSFEADRVTGDSITDLSGNGYQGTLRNGQDNNFVAEVPSGNDTLTGGAGNDQLQGGGGNDILIGDDNNQTLSLDGSNDYVAIAASSNLDLSTTSTFTLETQLNSTATDNGFHGIMGYHPGSLEDRYPGMWIINKTSIHFGFGDGTNWYHHTVNNVLTEGAWHHVAMTFDGTSFKLYVDAQEVFSSDAYAGKTLNTTQQIEIGKASGYYFEGQLDNVGVWNVARTNTEIQASMNEGLTGSESGLVGYWNFEKETVSGNGISDLSGNGNTGVVTNGQGDNFIVEVPSGNDTLTGGSGNDLLKGGGGDDLLIGDDNAQTLSLDGVNDYVEVANGTNIHLTNEITIETWIKVDTFNARWQAIATKGDESWRLHRYDESNVLNFAVGGSSVTGQTNVNDGQWHHVAATFDGEYLRLYVNGELDGELYAPGDIPQTFQRILLGANSRRLGRNFDGQLDEVQLWEVARTQAEIQSSMNNGIAGTEAGLVGYWNFDKNTISGSEISDLSGNGNTGFITNGQDDNLVSSDISGNDVLEGGAGDDELWGNAGDDELWGNAGDDELWGNAGDDELWGNAGNDTLTGGTGADRYVFESFADGIDVITDFNAAEGDRIVLTEGFGADNIPLLSFDAPTGALSYDGVQFATLENVASLDIYTAVESELYNPTLFSIEEHVAVGTVVGAVSIANPAGENAYAIASGNDDDIFTIDANTGEISVADDKQLDFETEAYHPLRVQTVDAAGNLSIKAVLISVTDAANEAPLLNSQGFVVSESAAPGSVVGTIAAQDDDGDSLTFEILSGNDDGLFTLDSVTGELKLADDAATLDYETINRYEFQVRVTDALGNSRDESMLVILDPAPTAVDDFFVTDEDNDEIIPLGQLLEDNGNGVDSDPDDQALTLKSESFRTGDAYTFIVNDGRFYYLPFGQFDYLAEGESFTESFTYTLQDEVGGTDTATVTVQVNGVNDAPVAVADEFDTFTTRTLSGNVLQSNRLGADYDIDASDQIAISGIWIDGVESSLGQQITLASGALLTVNSDGSFEYDPNGQVIGEAIETFEYAVSDGITVSDAVTATINVAEELVINLVDIARDEDTRGFVVNGSQAGAYSGFDVSMVGDVNGDGFGDFIIGAPKTDGDVSDEDFGTDLVVASGSNITSSFLDFDWNSDGFNYDGSVYIHSIDGVITRDGTVSEDVEVTLDSGARVKLGYVTVLSGSDKIYSDGEFTYIPNSATNLAAGEYITDSFDVEFTDNRDGGQSYETVTFTVTVTGGSELGASYVVFGKEDSDAIDLSRVSDGRNGFVISSETNGGSSGFSVNGGQDINGDDRPDIVIGAPFGDNYAGAAYALFTSENGFSDINLAELADPTQGLSFSTDSESEFLGYSSTLADVNGNGIADVIVSAPRADNKNGYVYVVFDQPDNEAVDLSTLEQAGSGFLINGSQGVFKGRNLENVGDINNDGYEDIFIGYGYGNHSIVFGKADSSTITINGGNSGSTVDVDFVSIESPDRIKTFSGSNFNLDFPYNTIDGRAFSGGGDINGDGISDVLTAEDEVFQNYVEFTVLFGKENFTSVNLDEFSGSSTDGFQVRQDLNVNGGRPLTVDPNNTFNYFIPDVYGIDQAAKRLSSDIVGDVNGDGLDDIAFSLNVGSIGANKTYVIFGKRDGLTIDLNQPLSPDDGFLIETPFDDVNGERLLVSFEPAAAGDVNGDGLADILIGVPFDDADDSANDNSGKSYVLFGADYSNSITQQGSDADNSFTGTAAAESFIGGLGNDTLTGGGGVDVLYGGAGDDRMTVSDDSFQRIDGGAGTDTLALDGSDMTLNIADVRGLIRNVEHIDLTGSGNNTLDITVRDLLKLSDTTNRLMVTGDFGDRVLSIDQDWSRGDVEIIDGTSFDTYTNGAAELLIETEVYTAISATFLDQFYSLAENSAAGVVVGEIDVASTGNDIVDVSFTDASAPFSTAFDAALDKWVITVQDPSQLDFESGNLILEVQATDSANLVSTADFSFSLSDVNEAPEFDGNNSFTIAEHSAIGTSVGVASTTDQDADNVITYSIISGNDANIFAIDSATGNITVANAAQLDYETQTSHSLTVRATDQDGLFQESTVDIAVTDETTLTYNSSLAFNITDADTSEQYTAIADQLEGFWDDNISPFLPEQTNWSGSADSNEAYSFWSNLDLSSGSLNADLPIDVQILMPDGIAPGQQFLIRSAAKLQETATLEASSPGVDFEIGIDVDFSLDAGLELPSLFTSVSSDIPDTINLLAEEDQDHFVQGSFVLDAPTLESNTASVDTAANSLSTQLVNQDWATVEANLSTSELNLWEAAFNTLGIPTEVDINAGEFSFTLDTVATLQNGSPELSSDSSGGTYGDNPSVSWTEEDGWTSTYTYTDSDYIDNIVWSGDLLGGEIVVNYKESYFNDVFDGTGTPWSPLMRLETVINYNTFDPSLDPRLGLSQYLNLDLNNLQGTIVFTEMLEAGHSLADSSATFDSQFIEGDFTSENLATSLISVPENADVDGNGVVEFETFVAPVVDLTNYTELDFALDYALRAGAVDYTTTARLNIDKYASAEDESGNLWKQVYRAAETVQPFIDFFGPNYLELTYNSGSINPVLDIDDTVGAGLPLVLATTPDIEQSQAFGGGTQATATTSLLALESDTSITSTFSLGLDENGNPYDPATFSYSIVGGDTQTLEYGQVTNNNDGTFTFDLNNEFAFLSAGDYEDVSFKYSATNGSVTQTRDVTIIVEGETDYTPLTTLSVSGTNSGNVDVDLTLINGALDTSRSTYLITHGWRSEALESSDWRELVESTSAYASANFAEGANVIFADWTSAAANLVYWSAAEDTEKVGDAIATYLHESGIDPTTTTVIGHSLGAHVSGNIGEKWRSLSGNSVDSIFGLDPAGPEFESGSLTGTDKRLDASDADRVIAFHSTAIMGYDGDLGDVDFYLNEWDDLVIPQPGQSNFFGDHSYPIELLAQLYRGASFSQNAASDFAQSFGSASFDASDLTATATGSFDLTTYSV